MLASCCNVAVGVARNDAKHKLECHCRLLLKAAVPAWEMDSRPAILSHPSTTQPVSIPFGVKLYVTISSRLPLSLSGWLGSPQPACCCSSPFLPFRVCLWWCRLPAPHSASPLSLSPGTAPCLTTGPRTAQHHRLYTASRNYNRNADHF